MNINGHFLWSKSSYLVIYLPKSKVVEGLSSGVLEKLPSAFMTGMRNKKKNRKSPSNQNLEKKNALLNVFLDTCWTSFKTFFK